MKLNPSRRVRVALYLLGVFLSPLVAYGYAKGWIGKPELALAGAWFAAMNLLSAANVYPPEDSGPGRHAIE